MEEKYSQLIQLIRGSIHGKPCSLPEDADADGLVQLARRHKLEPMIFDGLVGHPSLSETGRLQLERAFNRAVFLDVQFDCVRQEITQTLNAAGIDHVYMRGICLKKNYPVPALRTMSDMDILVHPEDFSEIRKAMLALGAAAREGDGNHRTYWFNQGVTVEFHPNLIHCASHVGTGVNPGWQYVPEGQAHGEQRMTEAGFYLNVMAHLANHFAAGGVGVRFVLDIWVCRHLRKCPVADAFVREELSRVGLLEFAENIEALAEHWFSGAPGSDLLEELATYIFTSGTHGESHRAMLNAATLSGSGMAALKRKVFYPKGDLENRFDWVRGRRWLLPAAWLVRAGKALTGRRKLVAQWGKGAMSCTREQIAEQKEKLTRFGVK